MPSQLFKKNIPREYLFDLFEKICSKNEKDAFYLINQISFRKLVFHRLYEDFKRKIKPYYNLSKQHYVERKLEYNSFINIVRQICKSNNIRFTSKIKYGDSQYNIEYYVYYSEEGGEAFDVEPIFLRDASGSSIDNRTISSSGDILRDKNRGSGMSVANFFDTAAYRRTIDPGDLSGNRVS